MLFHAIDSVATGQFVEREEVVSCECERVFRDRAESGAD
jgi:hypothetical protein